MTKDEYQIYHAVGKTLELKNQIPQNVNGFFINYTHNGTKGIIFAEFIKERYSRTYAKFHSNLIKLYGQLAKISKLEEHYMDILKKLNQIGFELKGAGEFKSAPTYLILKEKNNSDLGKLIPKREDLYFLEKITNQKIFFDED